MDVDPHAGQALGEAPQCGLGDLARHEYALRVFHGAEHTIAKRCRAVMLSPWRSHGKPGGRVAVVTGGASGIGAGIARACAEQGMRVVLADIELAPAERLARELAAGGNGGVAVRTDVTAPADLEALADAAFERFGAADVLFNNAGVAQGGAIHEFTAADWEWLIGVNLYGVVNGCRAFVPRWIARGEPAT